MSPFISQTAPHILLSLTQAASNASSLTGCSACLMSHTARYFPYSPRLLPMPPVPHVPPLSHRLLHAFFVTDCTPWSPLSHRDCSLCSPLSHRKLPMTLSFTQNAPHTPSFTQTAPFDPSHSQTTPHDPSPLMYYSQLFLPLSRRLIEIDYNPCLLSHRLLFVLLPSLTKNGLWSHCPLSHTLFPMVAPSRTHKLLLLVLSLLIAFLDSCTGQLTTHRRNFFHLLFLTSNCIRSSPLEFLPTTRNLPDKARNLA